MKKYVRSKLLQLAVVLVMISFFSFGIIYIAPGDVSSMYMTPEMTEEERAAVLSDLGLDKSMPEQYFAWAKRAIRGDFGVSLANKSAVMPQFLGRFPATFKLMGAAMVLSFALAIPLGLLAGLKKNTDRKSVV